MSKSFLEDLLNKWKQTLLEPSKFFSKENKAKNLKYALKGVVVAGVIIAIINLIAMKTNPQYVMGTWQATAIASIIATPIAYIIGLLILSGIFYIFAKALGGKGTYKSQTHAISLIIGALGIGGAILAAIPVIGSVLGALLALYGLYVYTVMLKGVHKYSTGKAVLTWLIPALVLLIILALALILGFLLFFPRV